MPFSLFALFYTLRHFFTPLLLYHAKNTISTFYFCKSCFINIVAGLLRLHLYNHTVTNNNYYDY